MSIVNNENADKLWSLLKAYIDEYLVSKNSLPTKMTPTSHASASTTYGVGSSSNYGHVKLSDSTTSTSGVSSGVAATPAAVRSVKEIADEAKTAADKAHIKVIAGKFSYLQANHTDPVISGDFNGTRYVEIFAWDGSLVASATVDPNTNAVTRIAICKGYVTSITSTTLTVHISQSELEGNFYYTAFKFD